MELHRMFPFEPRRGGSDRKRKGTLSFEKNGHNRLFRDSSEISLIIASWSMKNQAWRGG